jgi:hypothetical protein
MVNRRYVLGPSLSPWHIPLVLWERNGASRLDVAKLPYPNRMGRAGLPRSAPAVRESR